MPWFPYLHGVGADISDDERRPNLGLNVGQAEFLAVRAALGGDLRQVRRIAISLDSERETGRHHDARERKWGPVREGAETPDAAPQCVVIPVEQIGGGHEQVQHVGQRLPVAADHVVADVGQTD